MTEDQEHQANAAHSPAQAAPICRRSYSAALARFSVMLDDLADRAEHASPSSLVGIGIGDRTGIVVAGQDDAPMIRAVARLAGSLMNCLDHLIAEEERDAFPIPVKTKAYFAALDKATFRQRADLCAGRVSEAEFVRAVLGRDAGPLWDQHPAPSVSPSWPQHTPAQPSRSKRPGKPFRLLTLEELEEEVESERAQRKRAAGARRAVPRRLSA